MIFVALATRPPRTPARLHRPSIEAHRWMRREILAVHINPELYTKANAFLYNTDGLPPEQQRERCCAQAIVSTWQDWGCGSAPGMCARARSSPVSSSASRGAATTRSGSIFGPATSCWGALRTSNARDLRG